MKQFFKFFFASVLGVIVGSILLFFLLIAFLSFVFSSFSSEKSVTLKTPHVLEIKLNQPIKERSSKNPLSNFDWQTLKANTQPGLYEIINCINKAATDDNIKGIYLHSATVSAGLASIEEIRNALKRFRASGKFVFSYADYYDQGAYYLASVADSIFMNDQGAVDFRGFSIELTFLRGLFDKLDIDPQLIRHGKYKSAGESYTEYKMSPENRLQLETMVDAFWKHSVMEIAASRKLSPEAVQLAADSVVGMDPQKALASKLIDRLTYEDQVIAILQNQTGKKATEKPDLISLAKYQHVPKKDLKYQKDRIAFIFGTGAIASGDGDDESIGSDKIADAIRVARNDDKIKAIVFRVNSPGGSALASDVIWREIKLAKAEKPVVISMGDVAASGGYYISCAADSIFSDPNTITGSIGVIGLIFNIQNFLKNKLGVTTDSYKTGEFADLGLMTHPLSPAERNKIMSMIERIYDEFTRKVAEGRRLDQAFVDSIGQGRVWAGSDALGIGLIDRIGGFTDAIECAARMAEISEYKVVELPEQADPVKELLAGMTAEAKLSFSGFDKQERQLIQTVRKYFGQSGVQAILPFEYDLK